MALVDRAQAIVLRPRQEWQVIDSEGTTTADLYRDYILPLAAIGPVATLIGGVLFGVNVPFVGVARASLTSAIAQAVVSYAFALAGVYILAIVIDRLAASFGGTPSPMQALKVATYGSTASWLAGVFGLIPVLSPLGILGLYSLYLLFLGLPILMKAPQERALAYTAVVIVVAIVITVDIGAIAGALTGVVVS